MVIGSYSSMNVFITGRNVVVFDGDFNKVLQSPLAPRVHKKDIPKFIRLKRKYNKRVKRGEIELEGIKDIPANYKPYYELDFIEIPQSGCCCIYIQPRNIVLFRNCMSSLARITYSPLAA